MDKLEIIGRKKLLGSINISGSKNATLPILAASILSKKTTLKNVPFVKDIRTMTSLLICSQASPSIRNLYFACPNGSVHPHRPFYRLGRPGPEIFQNGTQTTNFVHLGDLDQKCIKTAANSSILTTWAAWPRNL